ncbi:MAG: hypothetical protein ACXW2I_16425 [Burkholderiales bacterium]
MQISETAHGVVLSYPLWTGSVYALLRYDHAVRWKDAADIYLEQRGGVNWHIVVLDRERRAFDFNVADLSIDDRDRIMAYMVDRIPESAFARDPTLLKRQAPHGPRPASFLGDQQIELEPPRYRERRAWNRRPPRT